MFKITGRLGGIVVILLVPCWTRVTVRYIMAGPPALLFYFRSFPPTHSSLHVSSSLHLLVSLSMSRLVSLPLQPSNLSKAIIFYCVLHVIFYPCSFCKFYFYLFTEFWPSSLILLRFTLLFPFAQFFLHIIAYYVG